MAEISKTADQALMLLSAVAEYQPVTATELCRRLSMNRTIAYRLLSTLRERGFVRRIGEEYALGPAALHIAQQVEPSLREAALPVMQRLCTEIGETIVLQVVDGDQAVILAQVIASHHVVRVEQNLIASHPLHFGASGRVLLAFQPERIVRRALTGLANAPEVEAELDRIRRTGYAVSHDELQWGVHAAAAPVFSAAGKAVAALTVLVPVGRAERLADHKDAVIKAAQAIRPD